MNNPRDTAQKLIRLAVDTSTPDEERLAAALRAAVIIDKHKLLSNPVDAIMDDENVRAAMTIMDRLKDPDLVDAAKKLAGLFGGKGRARRRRR